MEGRLTPAPALARARPDHGFLRLVRALCLGLSVVGIALAALMVAVAGSEGGGRGARGPVWLIVVPLIVAGTTFGRGDVREVRATAAGLELVGHDRVVRTISGAIIGGLGMSGSVVAGRLFAWFGPANAGRLVVVDRDGRVICARRAGWMRTADLEALAAAGGVGWIGTHVAPVPGVSVPPPAGMEQPLPGPARTDPATVEAAARIRRHLRRVGLVVFGILGAAIGSFALLGALPAGHDLRGYLGWTGALGVLAFLFGGPIAAVYGDHGRVVRSALRSDQPWWPVEAVVMTGLAPDASARMVGVVDHGTGEAGWWKVTNGGGQGWLQGDDRTAFWFLPGGKHALIAPPDRSHLAVLERRLLGGSARAAAAAVVRSEAAAWQGRGAWAAQQPAGGHTGR